MKKWISLVLSFMLIFSCCGFAFATECDCGITPVIYVRGFGTSFIYTDDEGKTYNVPDFGEEKIKEIAPDIAKALLGITTDGAYPIFTDAVSDICDELLGIIACDEKGNSKYNVTNYPSTAVTYEAHKATTYFDNTTSDTRCRYRFSYDWRLDPFYNAQLLKAYVDEVKAVTGHDKVTIACHSQGNTIVATYLTLYGNADFEKLIMLSPVLNGISSVSAIYTGEISFEDCGGEIAILGEYLLGEGTTNNFLASLLGVFTEYGVSDKLINFLQGVLDSEFDKLLSGALLRNLGTMPGLWVFVENADVEKAKANLLADEELYGDLIAKIDRYHNNVGCRTAEILTEAKQNGTDIALFMGYGIGSIPGDGEKQKHADVLGETESMSFGATVAPFGETLGKDYVQANTLCGHNHLSADGIIDASTALFPEYTWFVKNQEHGTFKGGYGKLVDWAILFDGQPDVFSSEAYPQFTENKGGDTLVTVAAEEEDNTPAFVRFLKSLIAMIIEWFEGLFPQKR